MTPTSQILQTGAPYILTLVVIIICAYLLDRKERKMVFKEKQKKIKDNAKLFRMQQYREVDIDLNIYDEIRELNPS